MVGRRARSGGSGARYDRTGTVGQGWWPGRVWWAGGLGQLVVELGMIELGRWARAGGQTAYGGQEGQVRW
jgi:hypothetical protein